MNAAQFTQVCDIVRSCITDVNGCRSEELENEVRRLRHWVNELCNAKLARKNDRLSARRADLIQWSSQVLAEREAAAA